jgi:hypothetical protein
MIGPLCYYQSALLLKRFMTLSRFYFHNHDSTIDSQWQLFHESITLLIHYLTNQCGWFIVFGFHYSLFFATMIPWLHVTSPCGISATIPTEWHRHCCSSVSHRYSICSHSDSTILAQNSWHLVTIMYSYSYCHTTFTIFVTHLKHASSLYFLSITNASYHQPLVYSFPSLVPRLLTFWVLSSLF